MVTPADRQPRTGRPRRHGRKLACDDPATWWAIVALIVGPQLLGHTIINLVLKDIDATAISVTIMLEPVVATLLAFVLFAETPSALFYPGAVAILTGIFMTSLVTRPQPVVPE